MSIKGLRVSPLCSTALLAVLAISDGHAETTTKRPPMFTTEVERCIVPAAKVHRVNPYVLRAILKVESNLNPLAVGKNENGTVDVGIGQHNSMHFKELKRVGVSPEDLKDACIGTYVAAWHLSKSLAKHGNTWFAVATYHSATPYFNKRYQVLIQNELIRSGVISGSISKVPPFKRGGVSSKNASVTRMRSTQDQVVAAGTSTSVAFDSSP